MIFENALQTKAIENAGFAFWCGRKTFWKRSFSKTITSRYSCDFPAWVFFKHKCKMTRECWVFKFLRRRVWTGPNIKSSNHVYCVPSYFVLIVIFKFVVDPSIGASQEFKTNIYCKIQLGTIKLCRILITKLGCAKFTLSLIKFFFFGPRLKWNQNQIKYHLLWHARVV